jgi:putative transposase
MPWTRPYVPPRNQRLSPDAYGRADWVYFVTIRAFRGQSPFTDPLRNRLVLDILCAEQERQDCLVFCYCLMPDHLHFLVSPHRDGVSVLTFTDQYKGKSTNQSWTVGWHGKLWQPRSFDHCMPYDRAWAKTGDYILNNPVRRGLVPKAEDWPWSGQMNPFPTW